MFSNWQEPLSILFTGGVDTKTDEKVTPSGRLTKLENGIFVEHGALTKRFGYDRTSGAENPQVAANFKSELVLSADSKLYSYGNSGFVEKADFENVLISGTEVCQQPEVQSNLDQAVSSQVKVFTWEAAGGVYYSVQENSTGQWLVNNVLLSATGSRPRAIFTNEQITLLWAESASTNIDYAVINGNEPTVLNASGTLLSDMHADGIFDVVARDEYYWIAYKATTTNDIRVAAIERNVVNTIQDTGEASVASTLINLSEFNNELVVVYTNSAATEINGAVFLDVDDSFILDNAVAITAGATAIEQLTVTLNATSVAVFYVDSGNLGLTMSDEGLSGLNFGADVMSNTFLASNAFTYEGDFYVLLGYESPLTLQNCYFLAKSPTYDNAVTIVPPKIVGQLAIREGTDAPGAENHLPGVQATSDLFEVCLPVRHRLQLPTDDPRNTDQIVFSDAGPKTFTLEFNSHEFNAVEAGNALYFSGSAHWMYDGVNIGESMPMVYPEPDITLGATAHSFVTLGTTGSMASGTYSYKIVYERRTHYNEVIRSYSIPFSVEVTGAGNDAVVLEIPTLVHTNYDDWYIVVYRTTDGGVTYHRVSSIDPGTTSGNNRWVDNDKSAANVTFTDGLADAAITDNDQELTTGGLLNNFPIPASKFVTRNKARVFAAGGEIEPNRVYYSKIREPGSPVEFNDQLFIDIDEAGGPITGLATLNDQLLIFKEDNIYYVNGAGPNNLGTGDFSPAVHIATDSGCTDSKAIVEMPLGVMFKSKKGIYMVGLNSQVQYIGAPVEAFNGLTTKSADLLPTQNAVVFLNADGETLYFDYNFQQWSTFTNHTGVAACVWQNKYVYVRSNGDTMIQNLEKYRDGSTPYAFKAKTGPLTPLDSLQGWFRVKSTYVLGEYFTPHKLKVDVFSNRDGHAIQTETFNPPDFLDLAVWGDNSSWGSGDFWGGSGRDYQVELYHHPQKFQSFKLEFTEIPDTTDTGKAFQIASLALTWAPMGGPGRNDVARRK